MQIIHGKAQPSCQRDYTSVNAPTSPDSRLRTSWGEGVARRPYRRGFMTPLSWLISIWGALTAILVVLLIYRGTLSMHEDDQLFLSDPDSPRHREQEELLVKMNKLSPMLKLFGTASGVLVLAIGGLFVYQSLSAVQ